MKNLVVFASGSGSNAEQIIRFFLNRDDARVTGVLSNNSDAFVHERARALGVRSVTFTRSDFYHTDRIVKLLSDWQTDLIILAGFMWLVPSNLLMQYTQRILNIHPALLPDFGGKGMYGHHVHEAVIKAQEKSSGITIHLIDEEYDRGKILFQASCEVFPNDTPESLAERIHRLEHEHYPRVIADYLNTLA